MRIDVVGKHIEITPAIEAHATDKSQKLLKVWDGVQQIRVYIEQQNRTSFDVEIQVDVVHHDDFISRAAHPDLYAAIDACVDKAHRQLRDFKDKLRNH